MTWMVKSPYDGSVVAEIATDDDARMTDKLARAHAAQRAWRHRSLAERAAAIERALTVFERDADAIATQISRQMGKPIGEARGEVRTMLDRARASIELAERALAADELPEQAGFVRRIEHHPLGVVLAIAAWNYPLLIPINVIVPGLLAGNAVLLKHSPITPLSGQQFTRAFAESGAPDLVNDLIIDHDQAARLIGDERIAHVAFTGSVRGGREVYRAVAATRLIDIGLELGGNDPAYVAEDADMAHAVANVVEGACYNAGQSCCAIERVYVHRARYDEFVDRAEAAMRAYVSGDPLSDATTLGPLARAESLKLLSRHVEDARSRGATVRCGGAAEPPFFQPTLLADVPQHAEVMREESFGPILPVAAVSGDDEAIARMDDTHYGLTAAIWTADRARAERFARDLDVGTMFQNRADYLDPAQPWTGVRHSGKGSTLSRYGFFHLTRRKSIHFRTDT